MKEISAVTLAAKTFQAGSLKNGTGNGSSKTASASFDSFLGSGSSKSGAVQSKSDTSQLKTATVQSQSGKEQLKTETSQQTADSAQAEKVQTDASVSQTDTVQETEKGVVETKAPVTDENVTEDANAFGEALAALNQAIRDIVKDITGMDDEMLSNVMSALGMTETDLLDTANLAQFVLFINGSSDTTDLLANEYMMSQFNDISDALADIDWEAITGMSKEEFMPLLEDMMNGKMAGAEDGTTDAAQNTGANQLNNEIPVTVEYVEEDGKAPDLRQAADTDVVQAAVTKEAASTDQSAKQADNNSQVSDTDPMAQKVNAGISAEQTGDQSTEGQTESAMTQSTQTETRTPVHSEILDGQAGFLQNLSQAVADATGEVAPQQASMQQMIDIVNQVVEQIKVTLGKETTSMEMQLNPESLGKVLIHVSSNHGVMTANFTVQTEEAKEALQSQMYSLREALESRSIKVDAVEVEVSDFAFSQSNQADAQDQKEFERGNGRRFRFSFEDDSDGEDGTVNAVQSKERQARPNLGGSIDFTA